MTTPSYDQMRVSPVDPDDTSYFAFNAYTTGVSLLTGNHQAPQSFAETPVYEGKAQTEWTGSGAETLSLQAEYGRDGSDIQYLTDPIAQLRLYARNGTVVSVSWLPGQWLIGTIAAVYSWGRGTEPVRIQWTIPLKEKV